MTKSGFSNSISEAINYFSFFSYPPTIEEIHTFLKKKVSRRRLASILGKLAKEGIVTSYKLGNKAQSMLALRSPKGEVGKYEAQDMEYETIKNLKLEAKNYARYTLGEYSIGKENQISKIKYQNFKRRWLISNDKINKTKKYIKILAKFPQVKLIGLSGSVAMMNAEKDHDVDLFIITAKNRLWTARFIAILTAQLINLRRRQGVTKAQDKICLNLFFDQSELKIPKFKQNEYVAHEILQMQPLVSKDKVYERFLEANKWVFGIFPNAEDNSKFRIYNSELKILNSKSVHNSKFTILNLIGEVIELLFKFIQLLLIKRHLTTEIVTDKQLWFFPDDFEKKIKF